MAYSIILLEKIMKQRSGKNNTPSTQPNRSIQKRDPNALQRQTSAKTKGILGSTGRKIMAALAGTGMAVASIAYLASEKPEAPNGAISVPDSSSQNKTPTINLTEEDFEKQDRQIDDIEKAFAEFAQNISKKAPKYTPQKFITELNIPLEVIAQNADNPNKNVGRIEASLKARGGGMISLKGAPPKHFYYSLQNMPEGIGAMYKDPARTINLDTNFNTKNLTQMFYLYHELLHVQEDEHRKMQWKNGELPKYGETLMLIMTSPEPIVFLEDEVRANAITLMAMNAYFEGALEKLGESAKDKDIAKLFGDVSGVDKEKMRAFFSMISAQTNIFYNSKRSEQERFENFKRLIMLLHRDMKFYTVGPDGGPKAL